MFNRTDGGLENTHLFHNADFTVYCEGNIPSDELSSRDEVFWEKIFILHGIKVHCQSHGGKNDLLKLANEKVVTGKVSHVIVAMDRDYDDWRNVLINHPQVIYSYGYSVESDLILGLDPDRVLPLFITLTTDKQRPIKSEYSAFFKRQSDDLRCVFALDFKYRDHPEALFNRDKPLSIIETPDDSEPFIRVGSLRDRAKTLGKFQSAQIPEEDCLRGCGVRRFHGKTVAFLVFNWFVFKANSLGGRKLSNRKGGFQIFMNTLAKDLDISDLSKPRNSHYAEVFKQIKTACHQ